jgi:colanic acid biosynthesis glycosyl transferase WcaI
VYNLTLISQYFYPEMISTGHILTELLVELAAKDVKASVICAQPTYYSREKVPSKIDYKGLEIIRTRNTQYDKNTVKGKLFNSASFFLHALALSVKKNRASLLLTVTNPPFLGVIGPVLKIIKKSPFILIIHDLYPDIVVRKGYLDRRSPITIAWRLLNRWIFRKASFIVVLGRDMQALLRSQLPAKDIHKVIYIPNWADPSLIQPISHAENPFAVEIGLEDKFLVQYSGNMGLTHDVETIIEAARELRHDESIHFLMIGGGGKFAKIKEMVKLYCLKNVTFLPYQPREHLNYSLSAAHVSIVSLEDGVRGASVPSKLYGIMASGRAIVANVPVDSEVAMTLKEYNCGIVTPPKDVTALVNAIRRLMDHEQERKELGERAYKAFLENFTLQICADQYYTLIKQINTC